MKRLNFFKTSVPGIPKSKDSSLTKSSNLKADGSFLLFPELDNLLEGFQILGFDYRYLYLNNTAVAQSHVQKTDLLGKKFLEVWPGAVNTPLFSTIKDTLENRKEHQLENEFIYPDGSHGWFELRFQPIQEGVMILSIDRTPSVIARMERERLEEELSTNEEVYRTMFANNPQPMWIYDLESLRFLEVNEAAVSTYGYSRDEFLSMTIKDIRPPEDIDSLLKNVAETVNSFNNSGIWRHLKRNGELIYITVISHSVKFRGRDARHVMATDVTEQLDHREQLIISENRLRELIADLQVGVILQGPGTEVIMSNPKALEFLGLTEEQLLGKTSFDPDWNVIHADGSPFPGADHPVAMAISSRQPVREVVMGVYRPRFNNRIWLLVDAFPQLNDDGSVRQVVCSFNNITALRKAEEDLALSEDLFNKAFHGSPSPMTIASQNDGVYIAVNDSFLRLIGLERENVVGKKGDELNLIDTEERKKILEVLKKTGAIHNVEIKARSRSGKILFLLTSVENSLLAGKPCTIATMLDITERKQVEEALIESETKFRKIYEEGPFGMAMVNKDFGFIATNSTFCQITGYTEQELQKLTFRDLTFSEDLAHDVEEVTRLIKGEIPVYKTEKRYIRKDGTIIWGSLTVTSNYNQEGQFLYNLAILEDITNRKQAEEDLRENRAYLNAALASMTDAVFISNLDGDFIEFNDSFASFHRFKNKNECYKKLSEYPDFLEVYSSDGEPATLDKWAVPRALRGEVATNEEYILIRKDTGEKWIGSYSFSPIRDQSGNIFGSVVVARDITDKKKAEEKISMLNETLEQKVEQRTSELLEANRELEAFSYSVSHDLRAPVRSINGFARILMDEYGSQMDEEGNRLCSVIMDSSTKMGNLIDDLLSFSRLGRVVMQRIEINMKEIAGSAFDELTANENTDRIDFSLSDICNSTGDPILLKQVWINLISNAIKYSSRKERSVISINCRKDGDHFVYSISDNGVGFDMAYKDKLFGVFQRLHSLREFDGTGVGLAIVQRIIHRHGGKVWALSEVDKGAEFYFSLPI
jgi:PAS domain S-box-containing protein